MKTLPFFIIGCLISLNLFSQTYFQGGIYNSTEWTKANSPYIITGDVVVFPDKTLTIQPGVEIRFNGFYFLEIRGILLSVGLDASHIVFTSNLPAHSRNDWDRIKIKNNQGAKASFEYCEFSNAEAANDVECCWLGGPIYFKNCIFDNNNIALTGYTGDVIEVDHCVFTNNTYCVTNADKNITNCTFTGNEYGLFATERINVSNSHFSGNSVALLGGRGIIDGCTIENNGIAVQSFFEGFELTNNFIQDNDTGIMLSNYDGQYPLVKNNQICFNGLNAINMDDINKDLTGNCWCTSDSAEIESKLIDGYDNIYLGLFNYDIYDNNCVTLLKSVIKVNLNNISSTDANEIVNVYPNPFKSGLQVEFGTMPGKPTLVSVYNTMGQVVYNKTHNGKSFQLDLSQLPEGVYISRLVTGPLVINRKIIKR